MLKTHLVFVYHKECMPKKFIFISCLERILKSVDSRKFRLKEMLRAVVKQRLLDSGLLGWPCVPRVPLPSPPLSLPCLGMRFWLCYNLFHK